MRVIVALIIALVALVAPATQAFSPAALGSSRAAAVRPSTTAPLNSVKITVGDGESVESAIQRFRRAVSKSGHLQELKHRRFFENSQEKKKRKETQARRRNRILKARARKMNR
jgi:small subunit ribosomal protein S21